MENTEITELANNIESVVNVMGHKESTDLLVDCLVYKMHRTLNQSFTGDVVLQFIRKMAQKHRDGIYDARNRTACEICDIMWKAVEAKYKAFGVDLTDNMEVRLPFI